MAAGAPTLLGTVGWVDAADEIWQQLQAQNINAQFLVVTNGSSGTQAIGLVAQTEGVFLDPVYAGKALVGLIDFIREGRLIAKDAVVFIHSGGVPALFACDKEIAR